MGFGEEARFKKKVYYMLEAIAMLKAWGLSSKNPMWEYTGESDPDRSAEALSKGELKARVNDGIVGVTSYFMNESGPLPLNQERLSDLVSLFVLSCLWMVSSLRCDCKCNQS